MSETPHDDIEELVRFCTNLLVRKQLQFDDAVWLDRLLTPLRKPTGRPVAFQLLVDTYYGNEPGYIEGGNVPEYGLPLVPLQIRRESACIRIMTKPANSDFTDDVVVERQGTKWVLVVCPNGGDEFVVVHLPDNAHSPIWVENGRGKLIIEMER